eukprot:TRINITY_DN30681_c0_g1_i1.p1 TRINITY_DN30681_c0_g1~~TRINITY_DN30681_c0_g1_i1.p1  ORF type:complete len:699 (-),score=92.78 TRINITY_DN30681_c0_g1_i1:80-2176(-)
MPHGGTHQDNAVVDGSVTRSVETNGSRRDGPQLAQQFLPENGDVIPRRKNKLFSVCLFILVVEMCERLCYYTVQGSQRNFLEIVGPERENHTRGMTAASAISISSCWSMLSYVSCLAGGYIADNRLGRYWTIFWFVQLYILGVVMIAVAAFPSVLSTDISLPLYLLGALVLVSIGTGAIKPNVMNFGADQFDASDPVEQQQQKSFFSYFYLTINIGVVGAFGYVTNLATSESTEADPGDGYFKSYTISAAAMTVAFVVYAAGTPLYTAKGRAVRIPMASVIMRQLWSSAKRSCVAAGSVLGWIIMPLAMVVVLSGSLLTSFPEISKDVMWAGMGLTVLSCGLLIAAHLKNDYIAPLSGTDVAPGLITSAEIRQAMACIPIIVCVNVGFNIPYNAMNNAYPVQACQMDTRVFGNQLNGSFFTLGDAFAIIVFVPILENAVYPALTRLRGGRPVTRWAKYTTGFMFGIAANVAAIVIERKRRDMSTGDNPDFVPCPEDLLGTNSCKGSWLLSKCSPNASIPMTAMSSFWTLIPMTLTGIGEILINPVIYQFVFEAAPRRLRSIVQALNLVAAGAVSNAITAALSPLVPENLNDGNIDWYFYANIISAAVMLVVYWFVAAYGEADSEATSSAPAGVVASMVASEQRGASLLGSQYGGPGQVPQWAQTPSLTSSGREGALLAPRGGSFPQRPQATSDQQPML